MSLYSCNTYKVLVSIESHYACFVALYLKMRLSYPQDRFQNSLHIFHLSVFRDQVIHILGIVVNSISSAFCWT